MHIEKKTRPHLLYAIMSSLLLIVGVHFPSWCSTEPRFNYKINMYADYGVIEQWRQHDPDTFHFFGLSLTSFNLKNTNLSSVKFEGLVDLIIPYGKTIPLVSYQSLQKTLLLDVRKLYCSIFLPRADITLGRQIISFGKGFIFSPLNIFSIPELTDINFRRKGSDIGQLRIPLGQLSAVELTARVPQNNSTAAIALQYFTTVNSVDYSLVSIYQTNNTATQTSNELLTGIAVKADALFGMYTEVALHSDVNKKQNSFELMCGADYSIHNAWFFRTEYLYAQQPQPSSLWGTHTVYGTVHYRVNDLMNYSISCISTLSDQQTIGIIQYYLSLLQNVDWITYIRAFDSSTGFLIQYATRFSVSL